MTFNLLNNVPCLEIDGKKWTKSAKIGTLYVVDNRIIISKNSFDENKEPELLHLTIDLKPWENIFSTPKYIQDPISVLQNFQPVTFQFKKNQLINDFHSIKTIGEGGFGQVFSAVNKIDWQEYAIKKVIIHCSKFNQKEIVDAIKEFRILAKLNHGNIVRYHTAWFEKIDKDDWSNYFERVNHSSEPVSMSTNKISQSSINSSSKYSLSNMTSRTMSCSESESSAFSKSDTDSFSNKDKNSENSIVFAYSSNSTPYNISSESINSSKHQGTLEIYKDSNSTVHKLEFALYIQMELCHYNLQNWLEIRNKQPGGLRDFDLKNVRCIARQLLKGMEYIHSNQVIHRDIKPANIFLTVHATNNLQLKIGDFGLSKLFEYDFMDEMSNTKKMKLTANTGTAFYSAPEVFNTDRKRTIYNHKCDLYSVGIILLELMVKFTTTSKLYHVINNLSKGIMFNDLMESWPLEAPHVSNLISICPETRPEANFILNQTCCFKEVYVQNGLYDHIKNIMSENSSLKNENELLRKQLENLALSQKL